MNNALGMIEMRTVSTGMRAADMLVKTAEVDIVLSQTVCPGKFIIFITGDISAVKASIDAAAKAFPEALIDQFLLGNPHPDIYPALTQTSDIDKINALGIIETFTSAACIVAADNVSKAADVRLVEIRLARGMCGKSYVLFTGSVAGVTEALNTSLQRMGDYSNAVDYAVIPKPDEKFWKTLL